MVVIQGKRKWTEILRLWRHPPFNLLAGKRLYFLCGRFKAGNHIDNGCFSALAGAKKDQGIHFLWRQNSARARLRVSLRRIKCLTDAFAFYYCIYLPLLFHRHITSSALRII